MCVYVCECVVGLEKSQKYQSKNNRPVVFSVCGIMFQFLNVMSEYVIKKYAS